MSPSVLKAGSFVEMEVLAGRRAGGGERQRSRAAQLEEELEELRRTNRERLAEAEVRLRDEARRAALEAHGHAAQTFRAAAQELTKAARAGVQGAEGEIVRLALAVAEKVVRREIAADPAFVAGLVRRCLARIVRRSEVRLRVHPADHAKVLAEREAILRESGVGHELTVVADPRVGRGGCVVETPDYVVDGTIESQLARAGEAIRGDGA